MKLSIREKILLITLAVAALVVGSYHLLFKPQFEKIERLKAEETANRMMMEAMEKELESGGQLDAQIDELTEKLKEKTKRFYPETLQDKLILAFDELLERTGTVSNSYSFGPLSVSQASATQSKSTDAKSSSGISEAKDIAAQYDRIIAAEEGRTVTTQNPSGQGNPARPDNTPVQYMNVTLKISGTYSGVMNFIRELEASNKAIRINNLSITKNEAGDATGSISADFYTLPLIIED